MALDLLIKDGLIVDGSGGKPYPGDVGIREGRIVAVGSVAETASRQVNADGLAVAPGFWDFHTHLDAHLLWDPMGTSSCWHGTTTVVTGNCGVTIAPCRPDDQDWLSRTLARLESMNSAALQHILPWPWEDFGGYLDTLDKALGVNVIPLVGHHAVRRYVMGADASERQATETELANMRQVVADSLRAGAFGLSSSRINVQHDCDGLPLPGRVASVQEYMSLVQEMAALNTGFVQLVAGPSPQIAGPELSRWTEEGMARLVEITRLTGRPLCWNRIAQSPDGPDDWRRDLESLREMRRQGIPFFALGEALHEDMEFLFEYDTPFGRWPTWNRVLRSPRAEKIALMKDSSVRETLKEEMQVDPVKFRPITWDRILLVHSATGKYRQFELQPLADVGSKMGKHPLDALLDIAVDEDLKTQFRVLDGRNWDPNAMIDILKAPNVIPGQSDAGAHQTTAVSTGFPTWLLGYWVREKQAMSLEEAVRRLSALPAEEIGIPDRGNVKEGMVADLTLFDPDTVMPTERVFVNDLPGGGPRLIQNARGIEYTIVNGVITQESGRHTGALPGKTVRSWQYAG